MFLRQIEYFQSVVRNNNFTLAAEEHHISQSAISRQIRTLEDELSVTLLVRKNRRFALTEAGEHFYKRSLVITADLEQLCRETVRLDQKDAAALSARRSNEFRLCETAVRFAVPTACFGKRTTPIRIRKPSRSF